MPTYRLGAKGPEVARIQEQLKFEGFYLGPVDGIFGGGTEAAARLFQAAKRLAIDGQVGPHTWAALFPGVPIPGPMFNSANALCRDFGLLSTHAVALMFDIKVQNGNISELVKRQIKLDFAHIDPKLSSNDAEVERLRIIANRRASATKAEWVEDVRTRKLTIANGQGTVHGNFYDLKEKYGLGLEPF